MANFDQHQPVLLNEVLNGLAIKPDGIYIDATFGRGGHSAAILSQLNENGKLLAIDKDINAYQFALKKFANDKRFSVEQGSFTHLKKIVEQKNWTGKVNGILLDLGVSSPQLDDPQRGFSFLKDGPLDMRMDTTQQPDAASWLQQASEAEICQVLHDYGEERFAKRIARAIVRERTEAAITTTARFAEIVAAAHPAWERHKHPATRSFQALRIFINHELDELTITLNQCVDVLAIGGRLAVISFHSLEDRIVKQFIKGKSETDNLPKHLPIINVIKEQKRMHAIGKAIKTSDAEIKHNPRARSAILRLAEKIL